MSQPTIFVSYSHKDEAWKDRLVAQLRVAELQDKFHAWEDRQIGAGDEWRREIQDAMEAASIAVFLISKNFFDSAFIRTVEIPRLLERRKKQGVRIMPLLVGEFDIKAVDWLSQIQTRPVGGGPLSTGDEKQIEKDLAAFAAEIRTRLGAKGRSSREWVPLPPDDISIWHLPSTRRELFGRAQELQQLDDAWDDPHTNVVSLVAWGGVGKSSLVNRWVGQIGKDDYRGAERVYAWSFYKQGTTDRVVSADRFIAEALQWFHDPDPKLGSPWEKGKRLAQLIRRQKTLLLLDGLEPLQYPSGQVEGKLKDESLLSLLRELAGYNPGLCVISTRLFVNDLESCPNTVRVNVENLAPRAGAELLESLSVKGCQVELEETSVEFDGHALALTLLGSYLNRFHEGNVKFRNRVRRLEADRRFGGHAQRVMTSYETWLQDEAATALTVLSLVGLFDRDADGDALAALRAEPIVPGLNDDPKQRRWWHSMMCSVGLRRRRMIGDDDWKDAVGTLRSLNLLAPQQQHQRDTLEAHPLIREHFGERFRQKSPRAWQEGHSRLFDHYRHHQTEALPSTSKGMEPLFIAVAHGCHAKRHFEAVEEVYIERILRRVPNGSPFSMQYFSTDNLGAFGDDLVAVSAFFEKQWGKPIASLTKPQQAVILAAAGWDLRSLGRMEEATVALQGSLDVFRGLKEWEQAVISACQLSQIYLDSGKLTKALDYAKQSQQLADLSDKTFWRSAGLILRANALFHMGPQKDAETDKCIYELMGASEFQTDSRNDAEAPAARRLKVLSSIPADSGDVVDHAFIGFRWCDLLLAQVESLVPSVPTSEIATRVQEMWREVEAWSMHLKEKGRIENRSLLASAVSELLLGRGRLVRALKGGSADDLESAANHLRHALADQRKAGAEELYVVGLLAHATLCRVRRELDGVAKDLQEAKEVALRGRMERHYADCMLRLARYHHDFDEHDQARKCLDEARQSIQKLGYHRRDADVAALEMQL